MEPGADHAAVTEDIRSFWNEDAATYDSSPTHHPSRPLERAAWAATLRRLLPDPPAAVLDVGAGTGFLSLLLAGQGYRVTAVDLSPGMLDRLRAKASDQGVAVKTVESDALRPPAGDFDAVVERHLLWTLPDPAAALAVWHGVASAGRLLLIEGSWGDIDRSAPGLARRVARDVVNLIRPAASGHHDHYSERVSAALPYGDGLSPAEAVALVEASPWGAARIERLRDVEWALTEGRDLLDTLLGTHPQWAVIAGS